MDLEVEVLQVQRVAVYREQSHVTAQNQNQSLAAVHEAKVAVVEVEVEVVRKFKISKSNFIKSQLFKVVQIHGQGAEVSVGAEKADLEVPVDRVSIYICKLKLKLFTFMFIFIIERSGSGSRSRSGSRKSKSGSRKLNKRFN